MFRIPKGPDGVGRRIEVTLGASCRQGSLFVFLLEFFFVLVYMFFCFLIVLLGLGLLLAAAVFVFVICCVGCALVVMLDAGTCWFDDCFLIVER